jgi:DinB family protein
MSKVEGMVEFEDDLRSMPAVLVEAARSLPGSVVSDRPLTGGFAMIEHVWHLADLETDAYEVRIRRILEEDEPELPGFDGEAVAAQRKYRALRLRDGIKKFTEARARNLAALGALEGDAWERTGVQEGVGKVTLRDIPRMMHEHDASHRAEIESLLAELAAHR